MVRPRLRFRQGGKRPNIVFFWNFAGRLWKNSPNLRRRRYPGSTDCFGRYNVAVGFIIRDFQPEDLETLWHMDQECFPPGISYSRQELKAYMSHRGSFTLVAMEPEENKVAGFIVVHRGAAGHIITIDVSAAARRSGVGSLLLRSAEDRLRAAGCRAVGLEAAVDNVSALSFYKRHGYSVIKTRPRYYSNGIDALVMRKELTLTSRK